MPDQPLQPFSPPKDFLLYFPDFSAGMLLSWLLYAVLLFWLIYTLVAVYHWIKYSHASWLAWPAIATHLFVSFIIISYAVI